MTFEWKHPKYYKEQARIRREEEEKERVTKEREERDGKKWDEKLEPKKI
jgi:hypothetical protein